MQETLKQKIEWMLNGGYLTNKGKRDLVCGIDLETNEFYVISRKAVKAQRPKRLLVNTELPLEDIHTKWEILRL